MMFGFVLVQSGDAESVLLFDPSDRRQALAARRLVAAKRKRTVRSHPASLANLIRSSTQMPSQTVEHVEMTHLGSQPEARMLEGSATINAENVPG
jgi:hypothetical protein